MKKFVKVIGTANVNDGIIGRREQAIYYAVDEIKHFSFFNYKRDLYGYSEPAVKVVFKGNNDVMVSKDVALFKSLLDETSKKEKGK